MLIMIIGCFFRAHYLSVSSENFLSHLMECVFFVSFSSIFSMFDDWFYEKKVEK